MNDRERAICARLKLFREELRYSLETFAEMTGISPHKLAGIEYARTPLKYKVAIVICEVFDLSAEWIVTGKGERHGVQPFLWVVDFGPNVYGNRLLSDVYDSSPELFQLAKHEDIYKPLAHTPTAGFDPQAYLEKLVPIWFRGAKFRTPFDAERFARKVEEFAQSLLQKYLEAGLSSRARISTQSHLPTKQKRYGLPEAATSSRVAVVKPQLPSLLKLLKDATTEAGKKSELAEFLTKATKREVPLTSVSRWLAGEREPGGEITLLLLKWVVLQQGKPSGPKQKALNVR